LSIWVAVLLIQSIPYAAAVFVSLINALGASGEWIGETGLRQQVPAAKAAVPTPVTVLEPMVDPLLAASPVDVPALALDAAPSERVLI
jgi:hypothetical protein